MKKEYVKAVLVSAGLSLSAVSYAFGDGAFAAAHAGGGFADKGNFAGGHRFANADRGTFLNKGDHAPVFQKPMNFAGNGVATMPHPNFNAGKPFNNPIANQQFNSGNKFQHMPVNVPAQPGQFANKFPGNNGFTLPNTNRPMPNNHIVVPPTTNSYSTSHTTKIHSSSHSTTTSVSVNAGPFQATPFSHTVTKTNTKIITSGNGMHPIQMGPGPVIINKPTTFTPPKSIIIHNNGPVIINNNHGWYRPPVVVSNHYYPANPYYWHHYPTCYHYPCYWNGYTYYNDNDVNTFLAAALAVSVTANILQYADSQSHSNNVVYTTPVYGTTTYVPYSTTYLPVTNTPTQFVPYTNPDQVAYASTSGKSTSNKTSSSSSTAPVYVTVNNTVNTTTPAGTTSTTTTTTSDNDVTTAAPAATDTSTSNNNVATPSASSDTANNTVAATAAPAVISTDTTATSADNLAATTAVPVDTSVLTS